MKKKKKNKSAQFSAPRCPYCGSHTILRSADGIYQSNPEGTMLYVCKNYPNCDAYVRVHPGTRLPMGTPANAELRRLRTKAHRYFNQLYEKGYMSKQCAYTWLAQLLCLPISQAHIGLLGEFYCRKVIEESGKLLAQEEARQKRRGEKLRKEENHNAIDKGTTACC